MLRGCSAPVVLLLSAVSLIFCPLQCSSQTVTLLEFEGSPISVVEGQTPLVNMIYETDAPISGSDCLMTAFSIRFVPGSASQSDFMDMATPDIPVCIPPGPASGTFPVEFYMTVDDTDLEQDEDFQLLIFPPDPMVTPSQGSVTGTIIDNDNDPLINLQTTNVSICEGQHFNVCAVISNVLTPGGGNGGSTLFPISVTFGFYNDTAVAGDDYTFGPLMAVFPEGSMDNDTVCVPVYALNDSILDGHETFTVKLISVTDDSGMGNAVNLRTPTSATITIKDKDSVTISIVIPAMPVTLFEDGTSPVPNIELEIIDLPPGGIERPLTVTLMAVDTIDPLTTLDTDFTVPDPFEAIFSAGLINIATVSGCQALQDLSVEGDHSFQVVLASVPAEFSDVVTLDPTPLTVTILDDDVESVQYILGNGTLSANEGTDTSVDFCATIILGSRTLDTNITFEVEIGPERGVTEEEEDFSIAGDMVFLAESMDGAMACVSVSIINDSALEFDHSFTLSLSSTSTPPGVTRSVSSPPNTTITINDDEADQPIAVAGPLTRTVQEADMSVEMVCVEFDSTINRVEREVTVDFQATLVPPTTTDDFMVASNSLVIPVGPISGSECINVTVIDDNVYEGNDALSVELTSSIPFLPICIGGMANIVGFSIQDPEDAVFEFASASETVQEGSIVQAIIVTNSTLNTSLTVFVVDSDDGQVIGNATFYPGDTQQTLNITSFIDTIIEGDETVVYAIAMRSSYTVGPMNETTVIFTENTVMGTLTIGGATSFTEGDNVTLLVRLDLPPGMTLAIPVTVNLTIVPSMSCTADSTDYVDSSLTVTFDPCHPNCTYPLEVIYNGISLIDDGVLEGEECFFLSFDFDSLSPSSIVFSSQPSPVMLSITETPPTVDFTEPSLMYQLMEQANAMTPLQVCVEIVDIDSIQAGLNVSVGLNFSDIDATDLATSSLSYFFDSSTGTSACRNLSTIDDDDFEGEETFTGSLTSPSSQLVKIPPLLNASFSILDPEDCTLSLTSSNTAINESSSPLRVTLNFTAGGGMRVNGDFTVQLETMSGTADSTNDFGNIPAHTIPDMSGMGSFMEDLPIVDDDTLEDDETFMISIPDLPECTLGTPSSLTVTILDDDAGDFLVTLSSNGTINEGIGGIMATLTLSRPDSIPVNLARSITVSLVLMDDSAEAGDDFTVAPMPEAVFGPCQPCTGDQLVENVPIYIRNDMDLEFAHSFTISIMSIDPSAVGRAGSPLTVTINDDEENTVAITFSQNNYTCAESDLMCTISGSLENLNGAIQDNFTVSVMADTSGDPLISEADFIFTNPVISFTAGGASTFEFIITLADDDDFEGDHSFTIEFSAPPVASGTISQATVVITDLDDATIRLFQTVDSINIDEGSTLTDVLCVELSALSGSILRDIDVTLTVMAGTAVSPEDFDESVITAPDFTSSDSVSSRNCIVLSAVDDQILESTQSFSISLSSSNANVDSTAYTATVNIIDNDPGTFQFEDGADLMVTEGEDMFVSLRLVIVSVPSGGVQGVIEVPLTVSPSGATFNIDYMENIGSVTFGGPGTLTPAEVEGNFTSGAQIGILDDLILEQDEAISIVVFSSSVSNETISLSVTIVDNEAARVRFNPTSYTGVEGDGQLSLCLEILTTAESSEYDITISLMSMDGTKTVGGIDFTPTMDTVTFPASMSGPINGSMMYAAIDIVDDTVFEGDEQEFTVEISSVEYPSGPSANLMCVTDCTATVTIEDNAADSVTVCLDDAGLTLFSSEGEFIQVCVSITQEPPSGRECPIEVTLSYAPYGVKPATPGEDYTFDVNVMIPMGGNQSCSSVLLFTDMVSEGTQAFSLSIASTSPSVDFDSSAAVVIEIQDNDNVTIGIDNPGSMMSVTEGDTIEVCVSIIEDAPGGRECPIEVTLSYAPFGDKPATNGSDFTFDMVVMIPVNQNQTCSTVTLTEDEVAEPTQSFSLSIASASPSAVVVPSQMVVIEIMDDDEVTIAVDNSTSPLCDMEGNTVVVCVSITEDAPGGRECPIEVTLSDAPYGNKPATLGDDFSFDEVITIPTNQTQACSTVMLTDDTVFEATQGFSLSINSASPVVNFDPTVEVVIEILDNDAVTVALDDAGSTLTPTERDTIQVCVSITQEPPGGRECPIEVTLSSSPVGDKPATPGDDYTFDMNVTIPVSGDQGCSSVLLVDDMVSEGTQAFRLSIASTSPSVDFDSTAAVVIEIQDNDDVTVALDDAGLTLTPTEVDTIQVCVSITEDAPDGRECPVEVTLSYAPVGDKPATFGTDFTFDMTVEIPTDQTQACSTVTLTDDDVAEPTQSFSLSIASASPSAVVVPDQMVVIEIMDDDEVTVALDTSVSPLSGTEGDSVQVCVSITDDAPGGRECPIEVTLSDAPYGDKPATPVEDFTYDVVVIIPTDQTQACSTVMLVDDIVFEATQTFSLSISSTSPMVNFDPTVAVIIEILDDDDVTVALNDAGLTLTPTEGDTIQVCVSITQEPPGRRECPIEVTLSSSPVGDKPATLGDDYTFDMVVTIPVSGDQACSSVSIVDDMVSEGTQAFSLSIASTFPSVDFDSTAAVAIEIQDNDDVTIDIDISGSVISVTEGDTIEVCVFITQDAMEGRECPVEVILSYAPFGDKPGQCFVLGYMHRNHNSIFAYSDPWI